jgi:hypothetical protein
MTAPVLLVDLENIQKVDFALVPADARVFVFYGVSQKKLPEELVVRAQPLGGRLQWIKISGQGPNALDFHIAFYLGQELAERPKSACVILSGDTGFDPLIRHVESRGAACRRVTSLKDAFPRHGAKGETDDFARVVRLLQKERDRPRKRTGLLAKVRSWLPARDAADHERLVARLFDERRVVESKGALGYHL